MPHYLGWYSQPLNRMRRLTAFNITPGARNFSSHSWVTVDLWKRVPNGYLRVGCVTYGFSIDYKRAGGKIAGLLKALWQIQGRVARKARPMRGRNRWIQSTPLEDIAML